MNMKPEEIENRLVQCIASITSGDSSTMSTQAPLHDLGIDSLGLVEILVFIEKTFNLRLLESGLARKNFETVQALSQFISKKLS
ncbi:MAG: acyl carrier protein [Pseudomonadota bacterium]